MRKGAEKLLTSYQNFISIQGSAEHTFLPSNSFDVVSAGQPFHWFNPIEAKKEFKRILKRSGNVLLVWNRREDSGTPYGIFLRKNSKNYEKIKWKHKNLDFSNFFKFYDHIQIDNPKKLN